MLISCCTVTQPGRLASAAMAVGDYVRQTHADRELVLLHDGDAAFDRELRALAAAHPAERITVHAEAPGQPLGTLRNRAIEHSKGELVCQWDDDDRYHPRRLELQLGALQAQTADFCFLADQLHWFAPTGELSWDDWDREPYPMNFVQGTLLGRRDRMPAYPPLRRGEDTAACLSILRAGHPVARLRGVGWCYVYVYHGANTFDHSHHAAVVRAKSLSAARLVARSAELRQRLAEYAPALHPLLMRADGVTVDLA